MSANSTKTGAGILGVTIIILCIGYSLLHNNHETRRLSKNFVTHPLGKKNTVIIKHGDTLADIFNKLNLSQATLEAIMAPPLAHGKLASIRPGQKLVFYITPKHKLRQIVYPYSRYNTLYIDASHNGFDASIKSKPVSIVLNSKSGLIKQSLAQAAHDAGMPLTLYQQLKDIYQGTIKFKSLKPGDHFKILYQEYYIEGQKDHPGNIIAADFWTNGKSHKAIYYTYPKNHSSYYTPDGHGIKPAFLRLPVAHYKRISSYFTYHRYDPYLHVMRPHFGIDYAAPRGTPIRSIGRGKIIFQGRDHGFGNAIVIRYSKKYKVLYGHMEKFAAHQHKGDDVQKGQTIGYIGSTGWSTGPHLHFEIYVYGIPKDPLKIKLPRGDSIPASYTQDYKKYAHKVIQQLTDFKKAEKP